MIQKTLIIVGILFVLVGIVVLFIKVNITKNKKTQKVKKATF